MKGDKQDVRDVDLRQCSAWLRQFNDQLATYNPARQTPDMIAIRLNMKISKVFTMLAMMPKPVV